MEAATSASSSKRRRICSGEPGLAEAAQGDVSDRRGRPPREEAFVANVSTNCVPPEYDHRFQRDDPQALTGGTARVCPQRCSATSRPSSATACLAKLDDVLDYQPSEAGRMALSKDWVSLSVIIAGPCKH